MYPTELAAHCAFSKGGCIEFPETAQGTAIPVVPCLRVVMRGGHFFDAPSTAKLRTATGSLFISFIRPSYTLPVPCALPRPKTSLLPYSYSAANNRGVLSKYVGTHTVTEQQAELLGWLLGSDSLNNESQSVRFTSGETAKLHRVQLLTKAFPGLTTKWYAKNGAYDITLTGGINNPLRHFLRMMSFYQECPMSVGRYFNNDCIKAFLRGVWGAQGWVYVRKGGNDVAFGLNRTSNIYLVSWLRLLHAGLGLQGFCEFQKNGSMRLVFNGFRNYQTFMREIGQFGASALPACPVRKPVPEPVPYLANNGESWYDAPVLKVLRLGTPPQLYRV